MAKRKVGVRAKEHNEIIIAYRHRDKSMIRGMSFAIDEIGGNAIILRDAYLECLKENEYLKQKLESCGIEF
jgi:hypothetical protein